MDSNDRVDVVSYCSSCGKKLDAASAADGSDVRPNPGDASVCLDCGHIMAFGEDMKLRELTEDEMRGIAGDKKILQAMRLIGLYRKMKQRGNH
jgi:hypothetical protein